jgi:hypothetical protein
VRLGDANGRVLTECVGDRSPLHLASLRSLCRISGQRPHVSTWFVAVVANPQEDRAGQYHWDAQQLSLRDMWIRNHFGHGGLTAEAVGGRIASVNLARVMDELADLS